MKHFSFWLGLYLFLFALGLTHGYWFRTKTQDFLVLVDQPPYLSSRFLEELDFTHNIQIRFQSVGSRADLEAELIKTPAPDLVLVRNELLEEIAPQGLLLESPQILRLQDLVHKDLLSGRMRGAHQLPYSWQVLESDKQWRIEVTSLAIPKNAPHPQSSLKIIKLIFQDPESLLTTSVKGSITHSTHSDLAKDPMERLLNNRTFKELRLPNQRSVKTIKADI